MRYHSTTILKPKIVDWEIPRGVSVLVGPNGSGYTDSPEIPARHGGPGEIGKDIHRCQATACFSTPRRLTDILSRDYLGHFSLGDLFTRLEFGGE